jgi:hypothetical protein
MRKKFTVCSDYGGCGSKKWWDLAESAVWSQAVGFVLVRLIGMSLLSALRSFRI